MAGVTGVARMMRMSSVSSASSASSASAAGNQHPTTAASVTASSVTSSTTSAAVTSSASASADRLVSVDDDPALVGRITAAVRVRIADGSTSKVCSSVHVISPYAIVTRSGGAVRGTAVKSTQPMSLRAPPR